MGFSSTREVNYKPNLYAELIQRIDVSHVPKYGPTNRYYSGPRFRPAILGLRTREVNTDELRSVAKTYEVVVDEKREEHCRHLLNGLGTPLAAIDALPA
jgi:amidase